MTEVNSISTANRTGYGFKSAGDKQRGIGADGGVWTDSEKAAEAAARVPGGVRQVWRAPCTWTR